MIGLIVFFLASITFSFLCSIWEAVLLSVTPTYIRSLKEENNALTDTLASYKKDIDRPLSAILSLNTIAHTIGAIGVGAKAGELYGSSSASLFGFELSMEAIIAGLMTLCILILSEIIPKTIGANYWKRLTPFTVASLRFLLFALAPLVWISQHITKSLKNEKNKSVLSRADISAMTTEGERQGAIDAGESTIIRNLLQLDRLVVSDIMTPRPVLRLADENESMLEFYSRTKPLRFSRIPLFSGDKDHVIGMILKDDLLTALAEDQHDAKLSSIKREIRFVKNTLPLPELFDILVEQRIHISVVLDTYGSVVGLVSMEDLFETILGLEITDETDNVENLQRLARMQWQERAKQLGLIQDNTEL